MQDIFLSDYFFLLHDDDGKVGSWISCFKVQAMQTKITDGNNDKCEYLFLRLLVTYAFEIYLKMKNVI